MTCHSCGCPCPTCHGNGGSLLFTINPNGQPLSPPTATPCSGCGAQPQQPGIITWSQST